MDTNSLFGTDVSQFAASVDWGDGTTSSAQVIYTGGGHYQVVGSHSFPVSGTFMVQTTVSSVDGASVLLSHRSCHERPDLAAERPARGRAATRGLRTRTALPASKR